MLALERMFIVLVVWFCVAAVFCLAFLRVSSRPMPSPREEQMTAQTEPVSASRWSTAPSYDAPAFRQLSAPATTR
jgi:hypothetical protein